MLAQGERVGGWTVVRTMHDGNLAVTYEVRRAGDGSRYALKLLHLRDPTFQERLRRTADALSKVAHPNLVGIIEAVEHEGAPGVVSRYVDGLPLDAWAASGRSLPEVLEVMRGLADALHAVHERGLVHRNLKPQKVIVTPDGHPMVHDFLLGKLLGTNPDDRMTQMGTTFGTPQYMSPEQFQGAGKVDARADLFSLGCLSYEMLTGQRAFEGRNLMTIYEKVLMGDRGELTMLRPDVPPAVVRLIDDLLAPDRDDRPPSAQAVAVRLDTDPALRMARGLGATPPPTKRSGPPVPMSAGETIAPEPEPTDETDPDGPLPMHRFAAPSIPPTDLDEEEGPMPTMVPLTPEEVAAMVPPPPPLVSPRMVGIWLALLALLLACLVGVGVLLFLLFGMG